MTNSPYGVSPVDPAGTSRRLERPVIADDRSIGEIMSDLTANLSALFSQELALAKAELKQTATRTGKGAGMLAGAGVAAHLALMFGSLALWWGLAHLIGGSNDPAFGWSFVIVFVLWVIVAAILAAVGRSQLQQAEGLPQTAETVSKIPNALKGDEEKNL